MWQGPAFDFHRSKFNRLRCSVLPGLYGARICEKPCGLLRILGVRARGRSAARCSEVVGIVQDECDRYHSARTCECVTVNSIDLTDSATSLTVSVVVIR